MSNKYLKRTDILNGGFVELIDVMGDDSAIVSAARVSYLSESKGKEADDKLIAYLYRNRHTSPFEQVEFKFRVKAPLFVVRQWFRHRTWSYNEVSRRYTSHGIEFHVPNEFRKQSTHNKQVGSGGFSGKENIKFAWIVDKANRDAEACYNELIEAGVAREQARIVLPVSLYTMFYAKVDLHNLLHFLRLRMGKGAQSEIREYADAMLEMIREFVPKTVELFEEEFNDRLP